MGKKDSANMAFQKVIKLNRNVPKAYRVNAFLEQIRNFDYDSGDLEALSELLSDIEYNREHRPYLDRIYHMTAKHYLNLRSDSIAIVYFNKSLRTSSDDSYLNALSYHNIADLYFDKSSYSVAGTYYDSTLLNYKPNSRPYRAVKKRLDNLQDVIYYESIAKTNDSILNVVAMTKDEQKQYFNTIIEKIKADKEEEQAQQTTVVTSSSGFSTEKAKKAGTFYFYEPATVAFGKSEFANTWGNRPLVDNWRWSKKTISNSAQSDVTSEINKENTVGLLTAEYYINQTPKLQSEIDSIAKDRNFAYYQLGLIYKNKFKDYERSKEKLEALLRQNPEDRLVLPSKYNLYKVYTLLLDKTLAASMKANIIQEYPTSRYAQILKNPAAILENDDQSPEAKYKVLFEKFEASKYQEVINSCEDEIIRFEGDEIVPKFELLKTSAKGRLYGFKDYKEGLNYIALNYPNSPEGKQSQDLIDNVLSSLEDDSFEDFSVGSHFKTIFKFNSEEQDFVKEFKEKMTKLVEQEDVLQLNVSEDIYDINTTFVVIHGLKSINGAKGFTALIDEGDNAIFERPFFAISSENYKTLQIHKNLDRYLEVYKN
jgi:tetratricopeptide (TPR) repeat protein